MPVLLATSYHSRDLITSVQCTSIYKGIDSTCSYTEHKTVAMASDDISVIKLVLRRHVAIFERCADCAPLLGLLRANKMIDEYKYQYISAQRTPIERNRYAIEPQYYT